jgi:hypothetical protein
MKTSSGREEKPCTEPSECRSCSAEILWVIWPRSGKWMPVDAAPDTRPLPEGGDILLTLHGGPFGELRAAKWDPGGYEPTPRNRYTSHFATCPNTNQHRRDE